MPGVSDGRGASVALAFHFSLVRYAVALSMACDFLYPFLVVLEPKERVIPDSDYPTRTRAQPVVEHTSERRIRVEYTAI